MGTLQSPTRVLGEGRGEFPWMRMEDVGNMAAPYISTVIAPNLAPLLRTAGMGGMTICEAVYLASRTSSEFVKSG
jgi:hypothetical protein